MPYPFTNRKRIRGWPRMVRKLEELESYYIALDKDILSRYSYCSYELSIAPFSNLTKRNPPGWYFRKYVESMLRVARNWEVELKKEWANAVGSHASMYDTLISEYEPEIKASDFEDTFSRLKEPGVWLGGYSDKVLKKAPASCCMGTGELLAPIGTRFHW